MVEGRQQVMDLRVDLCEQRLCLRKGLLRLTNLAAAFFLGIVQLPLRPVKVQGTAVPLLNACLHVWEALQVAVERRNQLVLQLLQQLLIPVCRMSHAESQQQLAVKA